MISLTRRLQQSGRPSISRIDERGRCRLRSDRNGVLVETEAAEVVEAEAKSWERWMTSEDQSARAASRGLVLTEEICWCNIGL